MRITRKDLNQILLTEVESTRATLSWESACESAERLPNGQIRVTLSDGRTQDCDLLSQQTAQTVPSKHTSDRMTRPSTLAQPRSMALLIYPPNSPKL
ncbi:hypothetical protein N7520_003454 [Penicillium odoratum]|uniref:uncharacterized protein n=1 Tax=Penicillium odoratum TaxID=1167516 RepID=UPI0025471EDF|nr:uncharacterized protein N7520_003454 [Penicillium odoratum]KAJ5768895.1 hypothetical protein N7520_003454 [Penicillium odoratum]